MNKKLASIDFVYCFYYTVIVKENYVEIKRKLPKDNFLEFTISKILSNQSATEYWSENKAYNSHKLDKDVDGRA